MKIDVLWNSATDWVTIHWGYQSFCGYVAELPEIYVNLLKQNGYFL